MEASQRRSVTDSPWFWVMIFALMSLGALAAISGKYGRRQAVIERQYQARQRIAAMRAAENNSASATQDVAQARPEDQRAFATPDDTLIVLWPLAVVLFAVAVFAVIMLVRGRRALPGEEQRL
jgi:hypothetical protein